MRLIDADALIETLYNLLGCDRAYYGEKCDIDFDFVIQTIKNQKVIESRPKGKWIERMDCEGKSRKITCDKCGHEEWNWLNPNFCSDCGADMRHER